jgi:hypothetical protein
MAGAARAVATTIVAVALFSVPFGLFIRNYLHAVYQTDADTWEPQGLAALSHRLGIAGFLAYSYGLEYLQTGDYFNAAVSIAPPRRSFIHPPRRATSCRTLSSSSGSPRSTSTRRST